MQMDQELLVRYDSLDCTPQRMIEPLVDAYETACTLSRGPDAARSATWTIRARRLETKLKAFFVEVDEVRRAG